jgi:hypothetical protein
MLFAKRVPARQFKNYEVDVFDSGEEKAGAMHIEGIIAMDSAGNVTSSGGKALGRL